MPIPGQKAVKPSLSKLHAEDIDLERIALRRAYDFDRTGCAVNIGKGHVSRGKLLADMSDHAVIDIDHAFDFEDVAGRNARHSKSL